MQDRFDVQVNGNTYTFRIPTIRYDIEVGYKASEIRNRAYPGGMGGMAMLDMQAVQFARYCAMLEMYLLAADTAWPWGTSDDSLGDIDFSKAPKIDFEKFPVDRTEDVYAVGEAFEGEVQRFRRRGDRPAQPAGA